MRIIIATVCVPFVRGGAELLASQLEQELVRAGHQTETVQIPFKWYPPERIIDQLLACRLLDISESCGVGVDVMIWPEVPSLSYSTSAQASVDFAPAPAGLRSVGERARE